MAAELLTVEEAAERLKINPQTIRRWIRRGMLPAAKIGRKEWRISEDDLFSALKRPTQAELQRRKAAVDEILALRERLRGRGISVQELIDESRRELEQRDEAGRH